MGHSKNRKKRRLGRIHKQAVFVEPMIPYYEFETSRNTRFDVWCGFEKWFGTADMTTLDSYDEQDHKELEFVMVPLPDGCKRMEFPNETEYGFLKRIAKDYKTFLEFDDNVIKGKFYHSKKATYYRKKSIKKFIEWHRSLVEKKYKEVQETEPEKIEDWVKEVIEKGRKYCGQK